MINSQQVHCYQEVPFYHEDLWLQVGQDNLEVRSHHVHPEHQEDQRDQVDPEVQHCHSHQPDRHVQRDPCFQGDQRDQGVQRDPQVRLDLQDLSHQQHQRDLQDQLLRPSHGYLADLWPLGYLSHLWLRLLRPLLLDHAHHEGPKY